MSGAWHDSLPGVMRITAPARQQLVLQRMELLEATRRAAKQRRTSVLSDGGKRGICTPLLSCHVQNAHTPLYSGQCTALVESDAKHLIDTNEAPVLHASDSDEDVYHVQSSLGAVRTVSVRCLFRTQQSKRCEKTFRRWHCHDKEVIVQFCAEDLSCWCRRQSFSDLPAGKSCVRWLPSVKSV